MKHTQTWTDLYGSALASFEGRAGGHTWLVAAPPELAREVPQFLQELDGKGQVNLLVHDGTTPLLSALQEWQPRGVLVVAGQVLACGPGVQVPAREVTTEDGHSYSEGGAFPAWHSALGGRGKVAENAAASAAASLGMAVVVTEPAAVRLTLESWMDTKPHGR